MMPNLLFGSPEERSARAADGRKLERLGRQGNLGPGI